MMRMAVVFVLAAMLSGCVVRHGDFSVLSDKIVDLRNFDLGSADRVNGVVGKDLAHIIIFIPTGVPTLEGAIDDALEKGGGDVMTDAVVEMYSWYIPYIYGQQAWQVKGDVVKTRVR